MSGHHDIGGYYASARAQTTASKRLSADGNQPREKLVYHEGIASFLSTQTGNGLEDSTAQIARARDVFIVLGGCRLGVRSALPALPMTQRRGPCQSESPGRLRKGEAETLQENCV
jgi:hypothetical protein